MLEHAITQVLVGVSRWAAKNRLAFAIRRSAWVMGEFSTPNPEQVDTISTTRTYAANSGILVLFDSAYIYIVLSYKTTFSFISTCISQCFIFNFYFHITVYKNI